MPRHDVLHGGNDRNGLRRGLLPAIRSRAADAGLLADAGEIQPDSLCVGLDPLNAILEGISKSRLFCHFWP